MEFNIKNGNEDKIQSLVITKALFERIEKYHADNYLITSSYNHGHGVVRYYTLNYCLQMNYYEESIPQKYIIKRGGKNPSKHAYIKKNIEELKNTTPTFNSLCRNIAKKNPDMVIFVNKKNHMEPHRKVENEISIDVLTPTKIISSTPNW